MALFTPVGPARDAALTVLKQVALALHRHPLNPSRDQVRRI
jgi:hypothetical protein